MNENLSVPPPPGHHRRRFLKEAAAALLGAVLTLVPVLAGLLTFLDPLRRKTGGVAGFVRVTSLSALADDGTPRRFSIVADRVDAWNKFPQVPIGAVYLRRAGGRVEALNVTCPHAGCSVEYKPASRSYLCPCHLSSFKLDGNLASLKSPSPRAMDTLEVEVRNETEIWVKFLNFEAGKAKKTPLA